MILAGLLLGLLAMVCWSLADIVSAKSARGATHIQTLVWSQTIGLLALAVCIPFWGKSVFTTQIIALTLAAGILGVIALTCLLQGLRTHAVGLIVPIATTYPLLTTVCTAIFLAERLTLLQYSAVILVVAGSIILAAAHVRGKSGRGWLFAVGAAVAWGLQFTILGKLVGLIGTYNATLYSQAATVLVALIVAALQRESLQVKASLRKTMAVMGLLQAGAWFAVSAGMALAPVAIVTAVAAATPALSTLLARLHLKERLTMPQILALLVVVTGMVLLAF